MAILHTYADLLKGSSSSSNMKLAQAPPVGVSMPLAPQIDQLQTFQRQAIQITLYAATTSLQIVMAFLVHTKSYLENSLVCSTYI